MVDEEKARRAVSFIGALKHTKGIWYGQPFDLLPWQERIVSDIFGTVKENGFRQYNTAYIEIPKKNGKSELAAAVALYMTCGDFEMGAEVYGCAADRQQASIVFDVACAMVEQCPALKKRIKPILSAKRLVYKPTNSFYQVLSAEAFSKHGLNVHAVIFDELHAQPNRDLFDVMTHGSGDARTQPLYFLITTAGTDRHSICFEQHQKAVDILQGRKRDPTFYPVIYGLPEEADWSKEENWFIANPSLGHTIDIEKVRAAYRSAADSPAEENLFRQLRLNQWVAQATRWLPMDKWDACADTVRPDELIGRECFAGLDLSTTLDLTAFVLVFPPRDEKEKFVFLPFFWIPADNLKQRVNRDRVPYDVWQKQGFIRMTEGNVVDYRRIEHDIKEIASRYVVKEIAYDRYNATQIILNLQDEGLNMIPFGQGFKDMSPPTKEIYTQILKNNIIHNGNPVLRWNFDNVTVEIDAAENIKPSKKHSTERIDGAVASIMGFDRCVRNMNKAATVYDGRGLLIL